MDYVVYSNNLFKFRTQENISQEQLANAVGICRTTIVNLEKGTQEPRIQTAYRLAAYFHVAVTELFPYYPEAI